jgi:hypothetical protein
MTHDGRSSIQNFKDTLLKVGRILMDSDAQYEEDPLASVRSSALTTRAVPPARTHD